MSTELPGQPRWLDLAWRELGQRELPGRASNPRIVDYIRRAGRPDLADDATAWCAAFVGACLERAGHRGTGSLMARSYLGWGRPAPGPVMGAVAVLSRGADPALGHVGFLVGLTDSHLVLLGGNQSDAVTVEAFPLSRLLGYRLPAAATDGPRNPDRATGSHEARFRWSLARILAFEGGYTDDPFDPGGPTNKGITLATYARFKGVELDAASRADLLRELRAIPDPLVARIYRELYWQPARCPDLPAALAHFHFDCAVNQGVGGAARMLQEALGVAIDGEIGPLTLAAADRAPPPATLEQYAEIRRRRYRRLKHFWRFGRGWTARVDKALAQSLEVAGRPAQPMTPEKETTAVPDTAAIPSSRTDAKPPAAEGKWWGNSMTVWGALVTAVTTVLPAVLAAFGIDVPGALIARLGNDIVVLAQAIGGLAGTVMTILGRVRATAPLARRELAIRL